MNRRSQTIAALFSSLLAASIWANTATEPVPRTDDWWQKRQAGFNTNVAAAGNKAAVLFIGDSITQGWEGEGKNVWSRYYSPRQAINLGIGGDRTQHVLWRLDNGNLKGLKPKAAVVMIGTNNTSSKVSALPMRRMDLAPEEGRDRSLLTHPPLRTGLATFTASGSSTTICAGSRSA